MARYRHQLLTAQRADRRAPAGSTVALLVVLSLCFQACFLPMAYALAGKGDGTAWLEVCSSDGLRLVPVDLATLADDDPRRELLVHADPIDFLSAAGGAFLPVNGGHTSWSGVSDATPLAAQAACPVIAPRGLRPPSRASPL